MAAEEARQPLPDEITSSIAGLWKRYTETRPSNASTEISGNVVRCLIPDSEHRFEEAMIDETEASQGDRLRRYRRDAVAAVERSTRCRVVAMINERDTASESARQIFVLDIAPTRASFGEQNWIVS